MALKVGELTATMTLDQKAFDRGLDSAKKRGADAVKAISKPIKMLVDPTSLRSLNAEMKKLQDRAAELRRLQIGLTPHDFQKNENAARDLEHELSRVEARMSLVGKASDDLRARMNRLSEIGGKIKGVGQSLSMSLTAPIVAAGAALVAMTVKTSDWVEHLDNLNKSTGLSTTRLQELKAVCDDSGLSFESVSNASVMFQRKLLGLEGETGTATLAMKQLFGKDFKRTIYDATGEFKSMDAILPALIQKLQGVGSETRRVAIATQIFGRGASDILPLLGLSADELARLSKNAHDTGRVIEDLAPWREFDKTMDKLKGTLRGAGIQLATAVLPIVKEFAQFLTSTVIPLLKDWIKRFGELSPTTKKVIFGLLGLAAALGPVLYMGGNLIKIFAGIWKAGALLNAALIAIRAGWLGVAAAQAVAIAANPVTWIVAVAAALVGLVAWLWKATDGWNGIARSASAARSAVAGYEASMAGMNRRELMKTQGQLQGQLKDLRRRKREEGGGGEDAIGPAYTGLEAFSARITGPLKSWMQKKTLADLNKESIEPSERLKATNRLLALQDEQDAARRASANITKLGGKAPSGVGGGGGSGGGGGGAASTAQMRTAMQIADEAALKTMRWQQNMTDSNQMSIAERLAGLNKIVNREKQYAAISLDVYAQAYTQRKTILDQQTADQQDAAAKAYEIMGKTKEEQLKLATDAQDAIQVQRDKDEQQFQAIEDAKLKMAQLSGDEQTRIAIETSRLFRETYKSTGDQFLAMTLAQKYNMTETAKVIEKEYQDAVDAVTPHIEKLVAMMQEVADKAAEIAAKQKALIVSIVSSVGGVFENAFKDMFDHGIKGFFQSIKDGFIQLINELVAKWLAMQALMAIGKAIGGSIGDVFAEVAGGMASGGPVSANTPYLIGERGPELFVPRSSGQIIPNSQLAAAGPTSNFNFTFNVSTPNPDAFRRSQSQIIDEAYRAGALAVRRNGG